MDVICDSPSPWNSLPFNIIWKIISSLPRKQHWKTTASSLKVLNKHWCDAVRQYATILKPKKYGPFSLSRDLTTVCQKFENLQVAVIEDEDADDAPCFDAEGPPNLKWLRKMKICDARMDVVSGLLSHAPYLSHLSIQNPRFPLSAVWDSLADQTSLRWLQLNGHLDVPSDALTPLDIPSLEKLNIAGLMSPTSCLPLLVNHNSGIQVLRLRVDNLSERDFKTLRGMKKLISLVLDGTLEDDVFDPASFPLLKHLVFSCRRIPLTIGELSHLTSLGLESRDNLENEQILAVLYALVARLDALDLHLPAAQPSQVSDVLSYGEKLTKLKIKNHCLTRLDATWMRELRHLEVHNTENLKHGIEKGMLSSIRQLQHLTSLKFQMNNPLNLCYFVHTSYRQLGLMKLTRLTLHKINATIRHIYQSDWPIRHLHITNWTFDASCFNYRSSTRFPLKNLCFSNCRFKRNREEQLKSFIKWKTLEQLEHLALPSECFRQNTVYLIDQLKDEVPGLEVDNNPDWPAQGLEMWDDGTF